MNWFVGKKMNMIRLVIFLLFDLCGLFFVAQAQGRNVENSLVEANVIVNLKENIQALKSKTSFPVLFPTKVPLGQQKMYASHSSYVINPDFNRFWQISADSTPDCQGVRVCNIGFVRAEIHGKLEPVYQTMPNERERYKEKVVLKNNRVAYYTPFRTMASAVNPTLEWRVGEILYVLSWQIQADPAQQKKILIEVANSIDA